MDIKIEQTGTNRILALIGAMDATGVARQGRAIEAAVPAGSAVTLDMAGVGFLDPSGIGLMVTLFKRAKASGGAVRLRGVRGQPAELLARTGLDRVLTIEPAPVQEQVVPAASSAESSGALVALLRAA